MRPACPWIRAEANIDIVNSWTKILRNHQIKWGIDIRRMRDDLLSDQTYSPRGIFYFGPLQTDLKRMHNEFRYGRNHLWGEVKRLGKRYGELSSRLPYQIGREVNTYFPALRQWQVFGYGADNWQVLPKLTLNLGLRWEFYSPPTPHFPAGFSNYDAVNNQLVIAGVGGNPMNMGLKAQYKYFAPRLGVAYRLTEKTVMRAGFGISYTPYPDNRWAYNYPVGSANLYVAPHGSRQLCACGSAQRDGADLPEWTASARSGGSARRTESSPTPAPRRRRT